MVIVAKVLSYSLVDVNVNFVFESVRGLPMTSIIIISAILFLLFLIYPSYLVSLLYFIVLHLLFYACFFDKICYRVCSESSELGLNLEKQEFKRRCRNLFLLAIIVVL